MRPLINPSFRAEYSGDPESSAFNSARDWIPACAGMTSRTLIRVSLTHPILKPNVIRRMLVVGLTGGIGSGKTTVANMFAKLGVPIIDTDIIARQLVEPGQPALKEIVHFFGPKILDATGQLDRRALRDIVFSNPNQRLELEAILHPRIRSAVNDQAVSIKAPYCLVVIPLLVETGQKNMVSRVLLIDAPETLQLKRTAQRDGVSIDDVMAILQQQASREERLAAANDVICNDGDLASLQEQVTRFHEHYLQLARSR